MNQIITMVVRRLIRRLVNRGVSAGIDTASRMGQGQAREDAMTEDQKHQVQRNKGNARQLMRTARRAARFTRF